MVDIGPTVLISQAETARRVGRSRWWIRDEVSANRFPRPVKCGRNTMFVEGEVEAWIKARIAERDRMAA